MSCLGWGLIFPLWGGVGHLSLFFGGDLLSYGLVFLTLWVLYLGLLARGGLKKEGFNFSFYIFLCFLILVTLIFTFLCLDLLFFYFSFEASLIPLILLIVGYGFQPEKLKAGVYILFYTLFGSLPLLIGFL